ncbi:CNK3/IPCEF1 fusion protein-like isoform X2 [Littorina saxatilis]|uniref:CNK3/IPCEF1 fusion protein-like isoform X2 n=1 Tax=Littorina saxatilis TaxID=31220 RepID=UPI0038B4C69C
MLTLIKTWYTSTSAAMASYQAQHILFENWTSQEVANWLQGLDESVAQYVPLFKAHAVNGRKLMMLNHSDLEKFGINKLGHQELVLEAVDLLRSLRYTLDTENLQSMALQLGCKARNLVAEIQLRTKENDQNRANMSRGEHQRKRLSITILSYVADMLATLKNLVSWLDRAPFEGVYDICRMRNAIVKLGLDLVTVTQRESSYVDPEEAIIKSCRVLIDYCDGMVQNTKDALVIQPAALEQATIRKKQGEELGMNIQSAYNGIHGISSIKDMSPADMCSKIEKGDEVLQVNGQTVLGWQLKELVKILKDKPKEVTLLLKKRPRHINPLGAVQNHKRLAAKHAQQAATLPKSLKKRRSREGEAKQPRPSLQEFVSGTGGDEIYVTKDPPDTNDGEGDGNDTDNDVFRSGSESPQYTLPVMPDAKQRRATVSGGSPTFERNSLMVEDPVIRPKSQAINKAERDAAALAILAASETNLKARTATEGGGEEGGVKVGVPVLRKTSSESSSGQKGPSESEMEDSVFSSDKEDKDPQNSKKRGADVKRQEFRVTKPTPMLLEPNANVPPQAKTPVRKTSSSSSSSVSSSTSTLISSPKARARGRALGPPPPIPPRKPSLTSKPSLDRPPSPLSAPPKRKKSTTASSLSMEGERNAGGDSGTGGDVTQKKSVSEPSVVVKPTAVKTNVLVSMPAESNAETTSASTTTPSESAADSTKDSIKSETQPANITPENHSDKNSGSRISEVSSRASSASAKLDKPKPLVIESTATKADTRPQAVQLAIHTEVATDKPDKDAPQLMKIKKLESPKATDGPNPLTEAVAVVVAGPPKQKKKVEFSADSKDPSPSNEVSYTHIIVGGVVQKIPIEKTQSADSPPVKMRQKPGSRRLDRRVSCKDLGKGDCEGWLYKRKEKDPVLAMKHWSKRWCILKNSNLYYYKNKEELKAEGVIFLPAFQVSPAPNLKTKKLAFKVHNSGTTFYFASERQDDMSKWMNKMGLAAISFDTSPIVTTGGFIKPEPRSNHLGVANVYYSESEEEDGASNFGSALSLNSLSSLGSVNTPQPSPPISKREAFPMNSDPGSQGASAHPVTSGEAAGGSTKGERTGGSRH